MMNKNIARYLHYNQIKAENGSRDSGIYGKAFESAVRNYVLNGKVGARDYKARGLGKVDASFYTLNDDGKRRAIRLEVKTCSGSVRYAESDGMGDYYDLPETVADVTEDMILPQADYVVYVPEVGRDFMEKPETALDAWVLPRADFIAMLYAMGSKGKMHIKLNKSRGQVNIQSLVVPVKHVHGEEVSYTYSDRALERCYNFLDTCERVETLRAFLLRHGRMVEE